MNYNSLSLENKTSHLLWMRGFGGEKTLLTLISDLTRRLEELLHLNEKLMIESVLLKKQEDIKRLLISQLSRGKDGKGNDVTLFGSKFYSESTILRKTKEEGLSSLARETRWITNFMYGNFYQSIYLKIQGDEFIFSSDIDYFDTILLRSGKEIMNLDSENLAEVREKIVKPALIEAYKNIANGL